jgi:hypothetical protein
MSITQIYTPGLVTIPITGAVASLVHVTHATTVAQNGPVCIAVADVTHGTLTINSGSWNGAAFTPDVANPRKAYLEAPAGETVCQLIGHVTRGKSSDTATTLVPAFQIIVTGAAAMAHVRIEGITKQVLP